MVSIAISSGRDQRILVEQVHILYRTLLPILAINLIVGTGMVYGLWGIVSQAALSIWLGMLLLLVTIRILTYVFYRRRFKSEHARRHGVYFILGSGAAGLLWGIGSIIFFPDDSLEYQLFILVVLVGMGAGSVSSLTTYLPAFFAYFPVSLLPIGIRLVTVGDPIHLSLGIMVMAYVLALCYFGMNINRALVDSLKLRFENIELVEQLRRQKDEAEQANLSKTKFLAAASHDLRQPLHALSLFTSVLDESIQYPKVRRVVDQIKASVAALQTLFNALLDISRLEAGVMRVEKTDFRVAPMLRRLENDFSPQAREKGLDIRWAQCDYVIHSDEALVEQILRNYLANAIRYTEEGLVDVGCKAQEHSLLISVRDTGVGIPEEERDAIFREFHQLNNPARDRSKGLGLGLAIVQRTATLLGHPIHVESEPGRGSCFSVRIERAQGVRPAAESPAQTDHLATATRASLIVIIDDEESVLEGTQRLLSLWGCEALTARDSREAIKQLREHQKPPDGIIADYRLQDETGIDAIRAIKSVFGESIPALIVTGDIATDRLREVNNSGYQVVHKPAPPAKLRSFLRNVQIRQQRSLN